MIFCNTTPLIALAGIAQLDLLPRLFGSIHLTESVVAECAAGGPIPVPELRALPWTRIVAADEPTLPGLLLSLGCNGCASWPGSNSGMKGPGAHSFPAKSRAVAIAPRGRGARLEVFSGQEPR